ncbi:MAG: type II toxin-antitoxin system PemK/MazF family toxin [Dehalococcoidia bacterium]|nr:putative endoribonuclease MazF2 [Chloroflexota bacterium]MBT9162694.1 putative endoribonuclease MazF2 [Chloroflexota bacterium]
MRRGEVWWAELPLPVGRRPVVLLSRDAAYRVRTSVTVGMVTRTIRAIPVEVPLGLEDGMPQECVVNLDDILTIPKARLAERITTLSPQKMTAVARAIIFALDLKG